MENSPDDKLIWEALEFEEREKSQDWFWALGVIVVTAVIASLIFANYFFAVLIVIAGALLAFFANKKPEVIRYELNSKGLRIANRLYRYESIKSFWVQVDFSKNSKVKPTLFIHGDRVFMPVLSIPIYEDIAEDIHQIMSSQEIAEVPAAEHPSEKIMELLGF